MKWASAAHHFAASGSDEPTLTLDDVDFRLTALERQKWSQGRPNIWGGKHMAVQIKLFKAQGGRDQTDLFSNTYLFAGNPDFKSDDAENVAIELAKRESYMFTQDTNYVRAVISDINMHGKTQKYHTRSFPLTTAGKFAVPVGDKVVSAHIVAKVERAAVFGRNGVSYYRHCITADEYAAWLNDRTVPVRFTAPVADPDAAGSTVFEWLKDVFGIGGLTPALPDAKGDVPIELRPITVFRFGGFVINDPKRPKKSLYQQQLEAAQQEVNDAARTARDLLDGGLLTDAPPAVVANIVELVAQLTQLYFRYPLKVRLKVAAKWPADVLGALPSGG